MTECDLCGERGAVETLELGRSAAVYNPDPEPWRLGRVCERCRDERLLPTLRHLFRDGTPWLDEPHGPGVETVQPEPPHRFFVFRKPDRETTHVARRVYRGPALGATTVCVGHCGIDARVEPDGRTLALSARDEGIIVCGRCARFAPERVKGAQIA